jgi:hypothetical protein
MSTDVDALRFARDAARTNWEKAGIEARRIRADLTAAQRRERVALRDYERARLQLVAAVGGREVSL